MGTIVVTGSASGIGAAVAARAVADGHRVVGIDRHDADIVADLANAAGRTTAIDAALAIAESEGGLDGVVTCAGLGGLPERPASLLVSVNYFGTVAILDGLRPALAAGGAGAAVAITSNSVTLQPGYSAGLVDVLLAGDEERARAAAGDGESLSVYPATKAAVARWVRRNATTPSWIGAGVRLNAVAPGMVETAMVAEVRAHPEVGPLLDAFPIPVGRPGRPEEIAAVVAFLLSPEARFFCGSVVFADGGSDALLRPDDWPRGWPERPLTPAG